MTCKSMEKEETHEEQPTPVAGNEANGKPQLREARNSPSNSNEIVRGFEPGKGSSDDPP
jgi:hypothetical protein